MPRRIRALAATLCVILLLSSCGRDAGDYPLGDRIRNSGAVVAAIRRGLKDHARTITISFDYGSDIYEELNGVIGDWVETALQETDDPAEGDYIRYQYGGYTYNSAYTVEVGRWYYTVELVPVYYCSLSEEERAAAEAEALLKGFSFKKRTSDYEKLRTVYDYLCRTVTYDKIHRKNPYSHRKSTAYAALVQHTATCQGYCTALYRLLRGSGINCRIVTGTAEGDDTLHAWVIAELDGLYYNLDPTWDAGRETWSSFLAGASEFTDHVPGAQFLTQDFTERYPIAETGYRKEGST